MAHEAPLSMVFPRQEYWNGLPFPSAGDFPHTGIETESLESPAYAGRFFSNCDTCFLGVFICVGWNILILKIELKIKHIQLE